MKHPFAIAVVLLLTAGGPAQTRRNSFVVDLLDQANPRPGEVTVAVTRDHWLYLRLDGGGTLSLDGQRVLAAAGETKRWVKAGEHRLLLSGSAQRLVVRTIPEIFAYMVEWHNTPGPAASYHYTKEFLAQYLLPHCTTLVSNAAAPYAPDAAAWQAAGGTWICNQGIEQLRKPEVDLVAYWRGILSQPMFDAVLHDEVLGQDPPHYRRWAEAMPRALAGLPGKRIYYWTPWSVFGEPDWQDYFSLDRNQPGEGQVAMRCAASPDKLRTFRQSGLKLKAGQRYTLSCLMRATALEAQATPGADGYDGAFSGVFIINSGWFTHGGSLLGADLAGPAWKRVSKTFTMPYSRDGEYQLLLCPPAKGTLWVDDLRLEPGNTVGGGENAVVNGGFEAEWSGWPSPDHFEILRKAVQDNDCRIAIEAYQNEMADEASLQQALQGRLIGGLAALLKAYPGFGPYVTVAFSGGNAPLRYSNDIHPEICWKTNLDRQFHAAANSPVFESVGGIGDWTLHYLDEEGVRWYGALYRHYLIEGSRAPLAALAVPTEPRVQSGVRDRGGGLAPGRRGPGRRARGSLRHAAEKHLRAGAAGQTRAPHRARGEVLADHPKSGAGTGLCAEAVRHRRPVEQGEHRRRHPNRWWAAAVQPRRTSRLDHVGRRVVLEYAPPGVPRHGRDGATDDRQRYSGRGLLGLHPGRAVFRRLGGEPARWGRSGGDLSGARLCSIVSSRRVRSGRTRPPGREVRPGGALCRVCSGTS